MINNQSLGFFLIVKCIRCSGETNTHETDVEGFCRSCQENVYSFVAKKQINYTVSTNSDENLIINMKENYKEAPK